MCIDVVLALDRSIWYPLLPFHVHYTAEKGYIVVGGAVTSGAGISAAFVCTCSSKQIYQTGLSIPSDFLAGEVSNRLGFSPDSFSMFFDVHP